MGLVLLIAFIGIPLLEIAVFVEAGDRFGLWPTLIAIVVTAVIGATLVRIQGFGVLMRARRQLDVGRTPVVEVFDGLCLLVAGALLLTPGFITDAVGFLLLVPPLRALLRTWIGRYLVASGRVHVRTTGKPPESDEEGVVIDAEYEETDSDESRWGRRGGDHDRRLPPRSPKDDDRE